MQKNVAFLKFIFCFLIFFKTIFFVFSQDTTVFKKNIFFTPSQEYNSNRATFLSVTGITLYAGTMYGLNRAWYANYPRSPFHLFNDNAEWNRMDKFGHAYTAYIGGKFGMIAMMWAGIKEKKAIWYGGMAGFAFLSIIEILDGFSSKWGFSLGDITANTTGSLLFIGQQLAWKEQRVILKFSSHLVNYPLALQQRADTLYGTSFSELVLKDYNGQTYWISVNISSFLNKESKFPKWLNIAVGYGADGMMGGMDNYVKDNEGKVITDFSYVPRYSQVYLSLDADLTKIKTKSHFLQSFFGFLNVIKFPAPSIEWNKKKGWVGHYVYF